MNKIIIAFMLLGLAVLPAAAATTLTVTNCADTADTGSLRWALFNAGAGDTIAFNIPASDPSYEAVADQHVWVIRINSSLPSIWFDNVYINGSTQTTFGGDTNIYGPEVVISSEAADIQGIWLGSNNCTVEGLAFNNFINGISYVFPIYCTGNYNTIRGCYFGTDATGEAGAGNTNAIGLKGSNNLVGGTTPEERNLISGNTNAGVLIWDFYSSVNSENNRIIGNYIGVDRTGTVSVPNTYGIYLQGEYAVNNTIGGTTDGERNVISGNKYYGVFSFYGSDNRIIGNYIGTDLNGTSSLGNYNGIYVFGNNNTIGGPTDGERNIISGNSGAGVTIWFCSSNEVKGNYIGTDKDGTAALTGQPEGVYVFGGASYNLIGGAASGERNIISGNTGDGIYLGGSSSNEVKGNYVGTDRTGTIGVPNQLGINLAGTAANNNIIGGTTDGERNIISGNTYGIYIYSGASSNEVKGNYIGTKADGATALPNNYCGVAISSSSNNIIGGTTGGERNIISGNGYYGIYMYEANHTRIIGNYIGTDVNGTSSLSNVHYWDGAGIFVDQWSCNNIIGGTTEAERNLISGNSYNGYYGVGIRIMSLSCSNEVKGNYIGTDKNGTSAIENGYGIHIIDASNDNLIGGSQEGEGNLISGNHVLAIGIGDPNWWDIRDDTIGNKIQGNYIGTDKTGSVSLANGSGGIEIGGFLNSGDGKYYCAKRNIIGGDNAGEGNIISGNTTGPAINIYGSSEVTLNEVKGNLIGVGKDGTSAIPNTYGIYLQSGPQGNVIGGANVISGNSNTGISIFNASSNQIKGNYIGLAQDGSTRGNGYNGIDISGAGSSGNIIGGDVTYEGNYIGCNGANGIESSSSNSNWIRNNIIGLAPDGVTKRKNTGHGINLNTASYNLIDKNVISGHDGADKAGIYLITANYNTITGNKIGTDTTGTTAVGNSYGIFATSTTLNTIGGSSEAEKNIISGNTGPGIRLGSAAANVVVQGNYIGTDINGENSLPNSVGVDIYSWSNSNVIGGSGPGQKNLISGNSTAGIRIHSNCSSNLIKSNWIGTKANGEAALPNQYGIQLGNVEGSNENGNIIGGDTTLEGNVISGNSSCGIFVYGFGSGNYIENNFIGLTASREGAMPNGGSGINVFGFSSSLNLISNEVKYNNVYGVAAGSFPNDNQLVIHYNTFEANSGGGVYNGVTYLIDCQYNDWGSPAGPYDPVDNISAGRWFNPGGDGQSVTDYVDYRYWMGWGTVVPENPDGFSGTALSTSAIHWSWADNTTREARYYVVDSPSRTIKVTSQPGTTATTESGLSPYTQYTRRAVAWKMDASSESDAQTVRTLAPETNPPTVNVLAPNGGEFWKAGKSYNISFTCSDPSGIKDHSANFYYTTGEGWVTIATGQTTNAAYAWTTPLISTTEAKVRVTVQDIYDNTGTDESNAKFTIDLTPSVEVVSPNGGEKLKGGVFNDISFSCTSEAGIQPDTASFYYTTGEGWVEITNGKATDAPYAWTTPLISTSEAKVRVTVLDVGDRIGTGESNSFFTIDSSPPMVNVLYPAGGETLRAGKAYNINFTCSDLSGVKLNSADFYYTTGEGWVKINTTGQATNAAYSWVTPLISTTEAKVRVNVQDLCDWTGTGESTGFFTIDITPSIEVTYPNGGQYLKGGVSYNISFTATSEVGIQPGSASFYYTTGEGWVEIATGQPADAVYPWTTPVISTTEAKIRITALDMSDRIGTDESNSFFAIDSIPPVVNVSSPNGGELWRGGVSQNITWTASDNIGLKTAPITLKYSVNNGSTYSTIAAGRNNNGSYPWTVPGVNTNEAKVGVMAEDLAGNIATDESNTAFTIDSTSPFVVSVFPTNDATSVPVSTEVSVVFSKEMSREAVQNAFSLSASPPVAGSFNWNPGGTILTFQPTADLAYRIKYAIGLSQAATDLAGNRLAAAFSSDFTTERQADSENPICILQIVDRDQQSITLKRGDYISKQPWIRGVVTDNLSLESSSIKLYLNDNLLNSVMSVISNKRIEVNYQFTSDLEDETLKSHTLKLEARDGAGNTGVKQISDLKVASGSSRVIGPILSYPQTFKPKSGMPALLAYNLTADTDVMIYMFNTSGENVWTAKCLTGGAGGRAGYNEVVFDGRSLTNATYLGNGIYTYKITANSRVIGTGYITIYE